jgi:acetamidase/formamidase
LIHELPLERRTLHGHFSRDLPPALTIDPGDTVAFATPNSGWMLGPGKWFEPRTSPEDDGHALAGPIEVRGAREEQTLVVHIEDVTPGSWGETLTHPPHRVEWRLKEGLGHASTGHGVHSTTPPRRQGGNIDCRELVAGTTLFLPIPVDGALFSAGDGHALQGDGEVSGTAIECPTSARLTFDLRDDMPLEWPCARIEGAWLTFGFDENLGFAAKKAVDGMVALMGREHGLGADDALALASVVVDLRVTQVVNLQVGVHAVLRDDAWRTA